MWWNSPRPPCLTGTVRKKRLLSLENTGSWFCRTHRSLLKFPHTGLCSEQFRILLHELVTCDRNGTVSTVTVTVNPALPNLRLCLHLSDFPACRESSSAPGARRSRGLLSASTHTGCVNELFGTFPQASSSAGPAWRGQTRPAAAAKRCTAAGWNRQEFSPLCLHLRLERVKTELCTETKRVWAEIWVCFVSFECWADKRVKWVFNLRLLVPPSGFNPADAGNTQVSYGEGELINGVLRGNRWISWEEGIL